MAEEEKKKKGGFLQAVKEFVYGVAAHDSARFAMKTRASMEHLFILITMGDMLGVPILPPYYSLRLLPYVVPQISTWKRRMLREKDFTDGLASGLSIVRSNEFGVRRNRILQILRGLNSELRTPNTERKREGGGFYSISRHI